MQLKKIAVITVAMAGMFFAGVSFGEKPYMQNALVFLNAAKDAIQQADSDKGGHRVKALASIEDAIKEVQNGIDYDKKH